jgi:hypothetical protein
MTVETAVAIDEKCRAPAGLATSANDVGRASIGRDEGNSSACTVPATPVQAVQQTNADLFALIFAPADEVRAGLELLAAHPLWPVEVGRWAAAVATVKAFEARFGGQSRTRSWDNLSLYGLSPTAPFANLAAMGAAWVLARSGHRAVAVTDDSLLVMTPTGSTLRIFRGDGQGAVLAWEMRKDYGTEF